MHYLLLTEWGTGSEIYPYMQSWVSCEKTKFSAVQSLMQRLLHEESLKIVLFGAGSILFDKIEQLIPPKRIAYLVDNNHSSLQLLSCLLIAPGQGLQGFEQSA